MYRPYVWAQHEQQDYRSGQLSFFSGFGNTLFKVSVFKVVVVLHVLSAFFGCGLPSFSPPSSPPHSISEDGAMHAAGYTTPFLCLGSDGVPLSCEESFPQGTVASCDSSGCHGTFNFGFVAEDATALQRHLQTAEGRHLRGEQGPSCFTCHGREWSGEK